jgi:hypothetical protein
LSRFVDDDSSSETRELPRVTERRSRHATEDDAGDEPTREGGRRRRADGEKNEILERLLSSRR